MSAKITATSEPLPGDRSRRVIKILWERSAKGSMARGSRDIETIPVEESPLGITPVVKQRIKEIAERYNDTVTIELIQVWIETSKEVHFEPGGFLP